MDQGMRFEGGALGRPEVMIAALEAFLQGQRLLFTYIVSRLAIVKHKRSVL